MNNKTYALTLSALERTGRATMVSILAPMLIARSGGTVAAGAVSSMIGFAGAWAASRSRRPRNAS